MLNITLNEITNVLNESIESLGGTVKAEAACDRMYNATFKSKNESFFQVNN